MNSKSAPKPTDIAVDDELDLILERELAVPISIVWRFWTEPELLKKWFVPAPWSLADCMLELRPGGAFATTMRSPTGEEHPSAGCFLEIEAEKRLVWTDALGPGYRPAEKPFMTANISFEDRGAKTFYRAHVLHSSRAEKTKHADMGFFDGWGKAAQQLEHQAKLFSQS